jgi:hypothetical protein
MALLCGSARTYQRLAIAAAAIDVVGTVVAQRHDLVGEPLGIRAPAAVPTPLVLAAFGTALSGPLLVDAALLLLARGAERGNSEARWAFRAVGWMRLGGVLSEPATWGRRGPRAAIGISLAHLVVAVQLLRELRM